MSISSNDCIGRVTSVVARAARKFSWVIDFCHDFSQRWQRVRLGQGIAVLLARQFIGAATTALSLIGGFLPALAAGNAQAQGSAPACDAPGEIALLPSPWAPWKGAPLRVMLVTEKPLQGELSLTGPDGSVAATSRERHGGPPYFWFTEIKAPAAGSWHATLTPQQAGAPCGPITREIKVRPDKPGGPGAAAGSTWPLRNV